MGNRILLPALPSRIISLVPSQTELLYHLGLDQEVVGITKYCIHPAHWLRQKTIVGGTKNFHLDLIDQLKPDLIIGNREENIKDGIEALAKKYPVWMSEIYSLDDSVEMIERVGELVDKRETAQQIASQIRAGFQSIRKRPAQNVLYLIWRKPWMAAGQNTFINDILERIGLKNSLPKDSRYPELSNDELKSLAPEVVFLSSEPYPFKEKHIGELQAILPQAKILLVDGEMFSWYGSRLLSAIEYLNSLPLK